MQVIVELVGASAPTHLPRRLPALPPGAAGRGGCVRRHVVHLPRGGRAPPGGQREIEAAETVQRPDEGDHAQQPDAPAVDAPHLGQVQAVVQLVEKGDDGFARHWPHGAPLALTEFGPGGRVHEDLVEARLVQLAGGGIEAWPHAQRQRFTGLGRQRHIVHPHLGIALLHLLCEVERRERRSTALRRRQMRVEQLIQFVIPGDDRASEATDAQKAGEEQTSPAVDDREEGAHG